MSNPVAPCIHAKTMAVATNDDDESRQGMMGEFPVRADASCTAPLFDVCEVGTRLSLSSRSVHQAEGAGTASGAQSLEAELIELAKVAAIENVSTKEDECCSIECMRRMYELLEKTGVNVNQADEDGWTALHHAANADNQATVSMLLLNGHIKADKTIKNKDGKLPIDLAKPNSPTHGILSIDLTKGLQESCEREEVEDGALFVLSEVRAEPPLSSGSVHQAEGTGATGDAQSLGAELIKLAKVEVAENLNTEEDERHFDACMEQWH